MIRFQALMLGLLLALSAPAALAFVDPPVLVPEHPVAGETVSISIRFGICDGWIDLPGYPQITRNGNSLRILLAATHASNSSWCNVPIGTGTVPVGAFGPGEYVLQVDRVYENLLDEEIVETLGVLPFTVTGAPSVVPTLDQYFRALLLFVILIFALLALRRRHVSLLLLLTLVPLGLRAQTASDGFVIALLLDESAGAPSPQAVVNYYTTVPRTGKPPFGDPRSR